MASAALSRVVTAPSCKQFGPEFQTLSSSISPFQTRSSGASSRCSVQLVAAGVSCPALELWKEQAGLGLPLWNAIAFRNEAAICRRAVCPAIGRQEKKGLARAAVGGIWKSNTSGIIVGAPLSQRTLLSHVRYNQSGSRIGAKKNNKIPSPDESDYLEMQERDLQNMESSMPDFDELDRDELEEFLDLELESSVDFETYKHYEIMFLIHEKNVDEVQVVVKMVQDFIAERKGVVYRLNDWGMRNLAYKIKKATRANYILMNIEIKASDINVLDALLEKDERVIRHMIISQKAAISVECKPPEEYQPSRVGEEEQAIEDAAELEGEEDDEEEEDESELVLQRE